MSIINNNIKWILIVIGLITCSMLLTVISPQAGLQQNFGATLGGPLAEIVVRSWGLLISITGGLLIYGALNPVHRRLVCVTACISKVFFVFLVLNYGQDFMDKAIVAVVFDVVAVLIMLVYLATDRD